MNQSRTLDRDRARIHYTPVLVALDILMITVATFAALGSRQSVHIFGSSAGDADSLVLPIAWLIVGVWLLCLTFMGCYSPRHVGVGTTEYQRVFLASFVTLSAVGVSAYLTAYPLSRGFYMLLFLSGTPLLVSARYLFRRALHAARRKGFLSQPTLVVGDIKHVSDIIIVLNRERWLGYHVQAALTTDAGPLPENAAHSAITVLGKPEEVVNIVTSQNFSVVIFAEGAFESGKDFNALARELEHLHSRMIVVPSLTDISATRLDLRPVAGLPLVTVDPPRAAAAHWWGKRASDLLLSSLAIIVLSPVFGLIALAIRLEGPGPVLFKQERAGLRGRPFQCYKFRSMVVDAEKQLEALAELNESDGVLFKMSNDPRVTKVGKFIRRYSLDELPQLFNIVKGEMSLVGPRPALLTEVANYETSVTRRLDVLPGLTGLWQVSGRSDLSWEDTMRLDLYYVDNWSATQDLIILLRTFGAVMKSRGAY